MQNKQMQESMMVLLEVMYCILISWAMILLTRN